MAYILLRRIHLLENQQLKRLYVCGCPHLYKCSNCEKKTCSSNCHTAAVQKNRLAVGESLSLRENVWSCSSIYYKSHFLHTSPICTHISLYDDLIHKRSFHSTPEWYKEDTLMEKSVKVLKQVKVTKDKEKENPNYSTISGVVDNVQEEQTKAVEKKSKGFMATWKEAREYGLLKWCWEGFKAFIVHYRDGFKLFWKELKICLPLLMKYIRKGRSSLKRREYKQLTRTLGDLVRMMPLIPMLIIPFGELLIPIYISIGMMPSVFMSKSTVEDRIRLKLQKKLEYGALLTESLHDIPLQAKSKNEEGVSTLKDFAAFMDKVKSTETMPSTEEILKFSRLFEDELTLDDLSVAQLQSLCKLLSIGFMGEVPSQRILRFQIGMKLRELKVDDKEIQKEGVDSLAIWELQAANRARGMRALGVSQDRLKFQLQQWLDLHLKEQIPSSLLLLSRVIYLDENLSPAEQLKQTISALPETTVDKVKVVSAESMGETVDKSTKLKILDEEQKAIKSENEREAEEMKAEQEAMRLEAERVAAELNEAKLEAERLEAEQKEEEKLEAERLAKEQLEPEVVQAEKVEAEQDMAIKMKAEPMPADDVVMKDDADVIVDKAEPIIAQATEALPDEAVEVEPDITAQDLGDIEKAIEGMAKHHEDDIVVVKKDLDEYIEDVEDIKALCIETSVADQVQESKGAQVLRAKLDKYLGKLDTMVGKLQEEKLDIQKNLEHEEVKLKYEQEDGKDEILEVISSKKENLIDINEVLLSLKRLQKVPDDVRMQKVLEVLDTDQDGRIDINDVLRVTEILGRENLKLNKSQVSSMMNLLRREAELEEEEKRIEKKDKELARNGENKEEDNDEKLQTPSAGS